jgi:hypothetical protein
MLWKSKENLFLGSIGREIKVAKKRRRIKIFKTAYKYVISSITAIFLVFQMFDTNSTWIGILTVLYIILHTIIFKEEWEKY